MFSDEDKITLFDVSSELRGLTAEHINSLSTRKVDFIDASNDSVHLLNETVIALVDTDLSFSEDDLVTVNTSKLGFGFSPENIAILSDRGVDLINWAVMIHTDHFEVDEAKALASSNIKIVSQAGAAVITDTGVNISSLSSEIIASLDQKGVNSIDASDNELGLSMDQYSALGEINLNTDDNVTLKLRLSEFLDLDFDQLADIKASGVDFLSLTDTGQILAKLSALQITSFGTKGVTVLDATDNALNLSLIQYNALGEMGLTATDVVTLSMSAAEATTLTSAQAAGAKAKGVDVLTVNDTGQALGSLTIEQIANLASKGVSVLDAVDNKIALSLGQYSALGDVKLTSSDTVILSDASARLSALAIAQISALVATGIDEIDALDDKLALSLGQYEALGATKISSSDAVTLSDTGAMLAALTHAQISVLAAAGIDEIDAKDNTYNLSSTQYNALGSIRLSGTDVVTIVADGDLTLSHGGSNLTLTGTALRGTDNSLANAISGNAKNNVLAGLEGNDFLYGGLGNDQLSGGLGKDVFVFDTKANKSTNVDKILDFKSTDDSIYLDNQFFTKLGKGTPTKPVKFKSDMFVENAKAKDKEDRIVYDKKTGSLYYDQDGTGSKAQVKIATISNKQKLYYHDFFVI